MDYTIKQGDNLSTIAKANNTTVGALASLNKLSNPNKIIAGQTLKLGVPTTNTNVANTAFNAPITQPQAVPPTINATTIGSQTPIQVPTTMPNNVPETMPATISTDNFAQSKLDSFPQLEKTDAQKFQESTIFDILRGTQETAGESAMLQAEQEKANVEGLKTQYKQIADKITARQAQLNQEYAKIGATPMSFAARSGYESAVRAAAESEIGALNAQAQAVAGDYEMAIQTAQRAVDAKYKPIMEKLEIQKAQLEAIKPLLARDEQKQAREMDYLLKQEERRYNKMIEEEKATQSLGLTLQQNQAPQSIINRVNQAKSVKEIMAIPGVSKYLLSQSDRLDIAIKSATLQEKRDAAVAAKTAKESGAITPAQAEIATDLRKEYNALEPVKSLDKSETDTKAILNALKGGKPTDDIAAINSFQRIAVDPGVSVREGDVALLQTANSFGDKAWLRTNGFMVGNKLTPAARASMQDLVLKIHDSRIGSAVEKTAPLRATAKVYNVDFDSYVASPKKNSQQLLEEVTKQQVPTEQKATQYITGIQSMFGGTTTGTPFDALFNQSR